MSIEGVKIYGVCMERLDHQIKLAKARLASNPAAAKNGIMVLESYNTGDMDDIIDILELYDLPDDTMDAVLNKLEEVAMSVSILARETINFDFCEKGYLCLYLKVK
ncbi:MAG: hypothetical protein HQK91_06250 [Nitrospirae bacterium]|nr:hypothetical protein [Nitrospirota bacterium]